MQKKENFLNDNHDIQFQLNTRINWDEVFEWLSPGTKELVGATSGDEFKQTMLDSLEALGDVCGSVVAPNAKAAGDQDPELKDGEVILTEAIQSSVNALVEFGISGLSSPSERGGMGVPFFIETCALEMVHRACPSTGLNIVWYSSIAHIIEMFGSEEQKARINPRIASGEWSGSMCLTEPDAGSDLGAISTYGDRQEDGSYRLHGTKRFISNGCGEVALVLGMKEKGVKGLENICMFLCLRHKEDGTLNFEVSKLEEKLALHGSATCELAFDGSHAELIGEVGSGFKYMLKLMNDARIATAFQGLGMMEGAHRLAAQFASERETWGQTIDKHPMIAELLLDMEVDIAALRSICYQSALNQSMMYLGEERLKDKSLGEEERAEIQKKIAKHKKRIRRWTPLVKWYGGERAVSMAKQALQIHGGYGFSTEYRAEFWYREAMILPIYEGTSQIQALMCIKDTMKEVIRQPKAFMEYYLGHKLKSLSEGDKLRKNLYKAKQTINSAIVSLLTQLVKENAKPSLSKAGDITKLVGQVSKRLAKMENMTPALLHAERLCEMKALVAMAETLVWDAEADSSRRWIAERFLNKSFPRLNMLKEEMESIEPIMGERLAAIADNAVSEVKQA